MQQRFGGEVADIEADITALLAVLLAHGLVVTADDA
jgi:hypothetical protein